MPCLSGQDRVRTYWSAGADCSFMQDRVAYPPVRQTSRPSRGPGHDLQHLECARRPVRVLPVGRRHAHVRVPRRPHRVRPPRVLHVHGDGGVGTDLVHDPQHPQDGGVDEGRLLGVPEDRAHVFLGGPVVQPGVLDEAVHGVGDVPVPLDAGQPDVLLEPWVGEHVQRGAHIAAPAPPRHVVQWHAAHGGRATAATGRVLRTLHGHRSYVLPPYVPHRPPLFTFTSLFIYRGSLPSWRCGESVCVHDRQATHPQHLPPPAPPARQSHRPRGGGTGGVCFPRRRLRGRPRYHGGFRGRPDQGDDLGPVGHQ